MPQELRVPQESFDSLIRNKTHKSRVVGAFIHIFNIETGIVEYILNKNHTPNARTALRPREIDGRTVMVEEDITYVPATVQSSPPCSDIIVDQICEMLVEGCTLKEICSLSHMPTYSVLASWRRRFPWVQERMDMAREDRGERLRDEAMEVMDGVDEDNVASKTAQHKALVWAAGVDNARYSPKAKIEATISAPTQIIVNTGIGSTRDVQPQQDVPALNNTEVVE